MKIRLLAALCCVLLVLIAGTSSALEIKGRVTVKGKGRKRPGNVLVWRGTKQVGSGVVDAEGRFSVSVKAAVAKEGLFVTADNPVDFADGSRLFLGCAKAGLPPVKDLELALTQSDIKAVPLKVVAVPNEPVGDAFVRCTVKIALAQTPGAPVWTRRWTHQTDKAGVIKCPVLQTPIGTYSFRVNSYLRNGDAVGGRVSRSGADLVAGKKPLSVPFPREVLSARVKVKWSKRAIKKWPAIAGKQPAVNARLGIKNNLGNTCAIEPDGAARYFELQPGKYRLIFYGREGKELLVVGNSNVLLIPGKPAAVVTIELEVEPTDPEKYVKSISKPEVTTPKEGLRE